MYDLACASRDILTLELSMEEGNLDLIILPQIIDKHRTNMKGLRFLLQCDGLPPEEQEPILAEIRLGERMCQEMAKSLEVAQQKVTDMRARCDQAERDLAEFAQLHGLEPSRSNMLLPSGKLFSLSLDSFPELVRLGLCRLI